MATADIPQNSILRISDDKTLQLIDLYHKEECLWNTKVDDYKNKEKRAKAAERIASALNIPNFQPRHVLIKFKNLRNSYSQELKKIAQSITMGDDEYRPKVFWFSKMDSFIRPHLQPARGCAYESLVYPQEVLEETFTTYNEDILLPDTSLVEQTDDDDSCDSRKRKRSRSSRHGSKRAKDNPMSTNMQPFNASQLLLSNQDDFYDSFGKYVAALLRSLPQQQSLTLQPKIINLITESMLKTED